MAYHTGLGVQIGRLVERMELTDYVPSPVSRKSTDGSSPVLQVLSFDATGSVSPNAEPRQDPL
jgi:hypothetical protein